MRELISVSEAAERLDVHHTAIRYYLKRYPDQIELGSRREKGRMKYLTINFKDLKKVMGLDNDLD